MSRYGGPIAETQSMPLREQLRAGIRSLDIRARHIEDRFAIHHGPIFQKVMFGDVLIDCNRFLDENPSETIVLLLSDAGVPGESDVTRTYRETFLWYRDQSGLGDHIYMPSQSLTTDLPLGSVRGKIVMNTSFYCSWCGFYNSDVVGNDFPSPATAFEMDKTWAQIVLQSMVIDLGLTGTLYENSLAGGTGGIYPIDLANGLGVSEGMTYRCLRYLFGGNQKRTTGMLRMDFPGSGLIAAILAHNMKYATNLSALAADFPRVLNDISYSATVEGAAGAADHSRQIKTFLTNIMPAQHWSVLTSLVPGDNSWGTAFEPGALLGRSDTIDGFTHVAISSKSLDPGISGILLAPYWTPNTLGSLSGDASERARGALALLKNRFPQARWNVAVKRVPFDTANWSVDLDAAVSGTTIVTDNEWAYMYTAWSTSATNRPPVAHSGGPYTVNEGTPITFDAGASADAAGEVLQYRWDFDGDGTWDTEYSYDATVTRVFADNPAPHPNVQVFDGVSSAVDKVGLTVLNVAPGIEIGGPILLEADHRLVRECVVKDPGSDSWTVSVRYGDGTPRVTPVLNGRAFMLDHVYPASGYFQASVDVRDNDGAATTTPFQVVAGMPLLAVKQANGAMVELAWSNHPAPFSLEFSASIPSASWQAVPLLPTLVNGLNVIQINPTNAQEYFRLALP